LGKGKHRRTGKNELDESGKSSASKKKERKTLPDWADLKGGKSAKKRELTTTRKERDARGGGADDFL